MNSVIKKNVIIVVLLMQIVYIYCWSEAKKPLSPASLDTPCVDTCDDIYEHCLAEFADDSGQMKYCDITHIDCQKRCRHYSTLS